MTQTAPTLETIGNLGLFERLNDCMMTRVVRNYQGLIDSLAERTHEQQPAGDHLFPSYAVGNPILYNALGAIYPLLNREQRDEVLGAFLGRFDRLNSGVVSSNHTPYIREPLLLTDIIISRPTYGPDLYDGRAMWDKKASFADLQREIMTEGGLFDPTKVRSDFLVAYALLRIGNTPFANDYAQAANPEFLRRVLKGITALRFARVVTDVDIDQGRARLHTLLPQSIYPMIEQLRLEADWTDATQFR